MNVRPLCVDLDGTLLRSDLLYESFLSLISSNPLYVFLIPLWLLGGKARLKREIASRTVLRPDALPYDNRVVELLKTTSQRPRVLCTASDEKFARSIANHLGLFEEVIASDGTTNMAGKAKAEHLVQRFGDRMFDYAGNSRVDLHVWRHAAGAIVANASDSVYRAACRTTEIRTHLPRHRTGLQAWGKALRLHQWLKNLLVFVPLLAAHRLQDVGAVTDAAAAFLSFGLCASGVYIINDLLDLMPDRLHERKRNRPFAAGLIPLPIGLALAPALTITGLAVAYMTSVEFLAVLFTYFTVTLAYSLRLKRLVMIDVVVLAALYTVRIIGGAAAIGSPVSFWLLAFSIFLFLSLALLKRYTELDGLASKGLTDVAGRGYQIGDLPLIQSMGAAAGYLAVLVLALYINSPEGIRLYRHPQLLWLLCPVLLYWTSRTWVIAHRGDMHDDPVVFAAVDRVSQVIVAVGAIIVLLAV